MKKEKGEKLNQELDKKVQVPPRNLRLRKKDLNREYQDGGVRDKTAESATCHVPILLYGIGHGMDNTDIKDCSGCSAGHVTIL